MKVKIMKELISSREKSVNTELGKLYLRRTFPLKEKKHHEKMDGH